MEEPELADDAVPYTKFPYLSQAQPSKTSETFACPFSAIVPSADSLVKAWANLLSRYTGYDDVVSFVCDETQVQVAPYGAIASARPIDKKNTAFAREVTGVFLRSKGESRGLAIEIHYDIERQAGKIYSNGHVPSLHLKQISSLLRLKLQDSQDALDHDGRYPSNEDIKLSIVNEKPQKLDGPEFLHHLVNFDVDDEALAIDHLDAKGTRQALSYRALRRRSARLSSKIQNVVARTVNTDHSHTIPILIPQSPDLYVAMLAALQSGHSFCPLQLDAPPDRIRFILNDVRASVVVTTKSQLSKLEGIDGIVCVLVDELPSPGADVVDASEATSPVSATSTAYIMYTSGSTGVPKGVPVSHRAATQSLLAHDRHIPRFSRFLQFAAPTFDVSIFEIFFTLYRHSTLIVCDRTRLLNDLPSVMRDMGVDAAELTPTVAGGLLQQRRNVPSLKLLLTIGEMLTPRVVAEFGGDGKSESILWGMYGPTEAAIHCTLQTSFPKSSRPGNIGQPLDTVSAFIVPPVAENSNDGCIIDVLPLGQVGELAVGGYQLADGYLNRDEQTAKAFVSTKSYGTLYRTGDKARILVDGTVECLGRITSDQVKLRGQRLELGEIRHAIVGTEGCLDAVVSIIQDKLVAFCLVGGNLTIQELLQSCQRWLPRFMIPTDFVLVKEFPRLPSGKADIKALESRYDREQGRMDAQEYEIDDPNLKIAMTILQQFIKRPLQSGDRMDQVGVDSLTAIRAASLLRDAGFRVSPLDLLSSRSLSDLFCGQILISAHNNELPEELNALDPTLGELLGNHEFLEPVKDQIQKLTPCTPVQNGMLVETMKDPTAYCNWVELQAQSEHKYEEVFEWFQSLAQAHEILRSGFCVLNSTSRPFVLITWMTLNSSQFQKVEHLETQFELANEGLLRPLRVQVCSEQNQTRIILQLHHALYDGWSMDLLVRDLDRLIRGESIQKSPAFAHIAEFYQNVDTSSALDYWQDHLAGFKPTLLPDFNGCIISEPCVEVEILVLSLKSDTLKNAADTLGVGRQVILQAAVCIILGAYSGDSDVAIGMVTSGRSIMVPKIDEIVGPCLATLPFRIDLASYRESTQLLQSIQNLNLAMVENATASIQSIRQLLDIGARQALYDVLFVWQESLESRSTIVRKIDIVRRADRLECALTFEFEPRGNEIISRATYHSSRLSRSQVALMLKQVDSVAQAFANMTTSPVDEIKHSLPVDTLSIANPRATSLAFDRGLESGVEHHAIERPNALAVLFATDIDGERATTESLTFRELNIRANQLAHFLRTKNLGASELICICMNKSLDLYVSILAVLKLGRGYLPVNPSTPLERIKKIVDEGGVSLCLSHRPVFSYLALESVCEVLNIDTIDSSLQSENNLETDYNGSQAAYAVFTSGSTGTPKGVLVTQQNLLSNLACLEELYPVGRGDRLLQACSQAFDVSVFEIFFTWQCGMCLCSATNDVLFKDIEASIRALNVTHLSLTPTVAALVDPLNAPNVRFLVTAGEGVTEKVKKAWADRGLFQGYGPSETTNICTVKPNVRQSDSIVNIGPPLRNTSAFVLDPRSDVILPSGAIGELCFGGDQVFRGYINQPELTVSKIIEHPQYGRLYRSGDMGCMLPDGSILFAQRLDDQVKIRGQRVELSEINHRILEVTEIKDCATLVVESESFSSELISFFVPGNPSQRPKSSTAIPPIDGKIEITLMRTYEYLSNTLPTYMVPSLLVPILELPVTVQGKIDRRSLLALFHEMKSEDRQKLGDNRSQVVDDTSTWSAPEITIKDALRQTLGLDELEISRHASFLSIGLDSISAISFARRIRQALGQDIPVSLILRNPSISRLYERLNGTKRRSAPPKPEALLPPGLIDRAYSTCYEASLKPSQILPCTPLQEAMLANSFSDQESYCNTMLFNISANLQQLISSWNTVQTRHAILRTIFIDTPNTDFPFVQIVLDSANPLWFETTITCASGLDMVTKTAVAQHMPPVVNSSKLPYFFNIISCRDDTYLQFSCHHALYDGTAISLLLEEVEAVYKQQITLPPVDGVTFLAETIAGRAEEHERFWIDELQDFRPANFRVEGREQNSVSKQASHSFNLIEKSSQNLSISLLTVFQAAWAMTLSAILDTYDVCFGNVVSGRTVAVENVERLVAPTFNTIPCRINLGCHSRGIDMLKNMQRKSATALNHQLFPLRAIQSKLGYHQTGIFSSLLLLQQSDLILDDHIWTLEFERGVMDFPLIIELIPDRLADRLRMTLYYNASLLNASEAAELLRCFSENLELCLGFSGSSAPSPTPMSLSVLTALRPKIIRPQSTKATDRSKPTESQLTAEQSKVALSLEEFLSAGNLKVVPTTTIFQLGIDSIRAIQFASRLRKQEGIEITAADLLEHSSIEEIANFLARPNTRSQHAAYDLSAFNQSHFANVTRDLGVSGQDIASIWPCTPVQLGLISQFLRRGNTYVNHVTYSIGSAYDPQNVVDAWKRTTAKHTMLRTGFTAIEGAAAVPFAMITYKPESRPAPVAKIPKRTVFDLGIWRTEQIHAFHANISSPPWALRIQETETELLMHLSIFHGLYDATSLQLILADVYDLLEGRAIGPELKFDPVLSDILTSSASSSGGEESAKFWKKHLGDAPFNSFPDLTPLHVAESRTAVVSKTLDSAFQDIERDCHAGGFSLQAAAQVAWAKLLCAYLGDTVAVFGVVLSGRDFTPDAEQFAFPCLVTVPFATSLSDKTNVELVEAAMEFNSSVRKHQFSRTSDIQRWLGREVLFDTILALQKMQTETKNVPCWEPVDEVSSDEYALSIELEPSPAGRLIVRTTFKTHQIPAEQAEMIIEHFIFLLEDVIGNFESSATRVRQSMPSILSITPAKDFMLDSPVTLLHEFVEQRSFQMPGKLAFEFFERDKNGVLGSRTWSYKDLNREGNQVANLLVHHGVRPGSYVGICFDKCPEASFGILGILKAGCAYVAIDPTAPAARKSFIVEDSKMTMILTAGRTADRFASTTISVPIIYLDELEPTDISLSQPILAQAIGSDTVSYCLYTSGTTGTPKGCEITHENAVQAMRAFSRLFSGRWNADSRWLQFASFHFDVSVLEQYWTWSEGICVVSAPRDVIFENIEDTIRDFNITHIDLTPSLASLVNPKNVPSLCKGVFITGGEQLKQEILDKWGAEEVIHNGYGPTEATIGVTMYTRVPKNGKPANIGRQFDNVGTYVLQPSTNSPVLRGAVGELCIAGKLVGKGYLNRPDLTAEKFPYLPSFGERIYRTGDLVRILHDGTFLFLGRADDQVKLRGQRLEIGEINSTILKNVTAIEEVVTYVLRHPKQQRDQLVTFFVCTKDKTNIQEISFISNKACSAQAKEVCQAELPIYMVPTYFLSVNRMPLSSNNKTEAKVLKDVFSNLSSETLQALSEVESTTLSENERSVAQILADFVKIDVGSINPSSNIFELGLDSISVIGFANSLKKARFRGATASLIMTNSSIKRMTNALTDPASDKHRETQIAAARQNIAAFGRRYLSKAIRVFESSSDDIETVAPCTSLQEGMLLKAVELPDRMLYFSSFDFALSEKVGINSLEQAWKDTCADLPILRTRFVQTNEGYAQVVFRTSNAPFEVIKQRRKPTMETQHDRRLLWSRQNRAHFFAPLELIVWDTQEGRTMTLHIFHALYDGNCFSDILAMLHAKYAGTKSTAIGPDFFTALPYGPLLKLKEARQFWSNTARAVPGNTMRSDGEPSSVVKVLSDLDQFDNIRRRLNVTHQALVQAAWIATLGKLEKTASVSVGVICSGRSIDIPDAERIIGPMFNTIPFHVQLNSNHTWEDLINSCHKFNVQSLQYHHTPLRLIQKWCKMRRDQQLFGSLFAFQMERSDISLSLNNDMFTALSDEAEVEYPVSFEAMLTCDGALNVTIASLGNSINGTLISDIADDFEGYLHAMLDDPDSRTSDYLPGDGGDKLLTNGSAKEDARILGSQDSNLSWSTDASTLRSEIATLSSIPEGQVKADVSIFELGLDSIDAIKLSSRLGTKGIKLPVSSIMRNPTIQGMLSVAGRNSDGSIVKTALLERTVTKLTKYFNSFEDFRSLFGTRRVLPATPLQEGMLSEMLASDFSRYLNHDVLQIPETIDDERLKIAWERVFKSNSILRTAFYPVTDARLSNSFAQVISEDTTLPWTCIDLPRDQDLQLLMDDVRQNMRNDFPGRVLFQLTLIRTPSKRFLILSMAHALYDGFSVGLLHHDVQAVYHEEDIQERPSADTILEEILNVTASPEAQDFWSDQLMDATPCILPRKPGNPPDDAAVNIHRTELFSQFQLTKIRSFCQEQSITLQTLAQTAFSLVLASHVGRSDVCFGVVLSGRDTEESQQVMFPTMNTVVFRSFLHGSKSELLQQTQDTMSAIRTYQHYPLSKAQRFADLGGSRLFDALFILQIKPELESTKSALYGSIDGSSSVELPLCVELEVVEQRLTWRAACHDEVFSIQETEDLLRRIESVMNHLLNEPDDEAMLFEGDKVRIGAIPPFALSDGLAQVDVVPSVDQSGSQATDATISIVRSILSQMSQVPEYEISLQSSLYHLGLDSISAIKISSLLKAQNLIISVSNLLRASNVQNIANKIQEASIQSNSHFEHSSKLESRREFHDMFDIVNDLLRDIVDRDIYSIILPATAGQIYMLNAWANSRGRMFFDEFKFEVATRTSVERISAAFEKLIKNHAILRTTFLCSRDKSIPAVQAVIQLGKVSSYAEELPQRSKTASSNLSTGRIHINVLSRQEDKLEQPFVSLFYQQRSDKVWQFGLEIHHALYDGISLPEILGDLQHLITSSPIQNDREYTQAEDDLTEFEDFAYIALESRTSESTRQFWTTYLRPLSHKSLVSTFSDFQAHKIRFALYEPRFISSIRAQSVTARKHGLSLPSIFLAVYAKLYHELKAHEIKEAGSTTDHVAIGVYIANRSSTSTRLNTFPTVNLVPICVNASLPTLESAAQVQKDLTEVSEVTNVSAGLWQIKEWTGVRVETFVNWLRMPDGDGRDDSQIEDTFRIVESMDKVVEDEAKQFAIPRELLNLSGTEAYLPALDVEVAVRDGAIDLGLFGPCAVIQPDRARRLLVQLRDELMALGD